MSFRCSICNNPAAKDLVDSALLAGERPADVLRRYQEFLKISASSLYRHARAHRPTAALSVSWLDGDSTTGELVADLSIQRRSHVEQRDRALARGDHTTATREGHEAAALGLALLKHGITDDGAAEALADAERLIRATQRASRDRPEYARDLAAAARDLKYDSLADDADQLAASAEEFNRTIRN